MFLLGALIGGTVGSGFLFLFMRKRIIELEEHKVAIYAELLQTQNRFAILQEMVSENDQKDHLPRSMVQ